MDELPTFLEGFDLALAFRIFMAMMTLIRGSIAEVTAASIAVYNFIIRL